ncbi:MAG: hypothetical protein OEM52_10125 [bacterium]|nr:hypothetical protein [bacterium]
MKNDTLSQLDSTKISVPVPVQNTQPATPAPTGILRTERLNVMLFILLIGTLVIVFLFLAKTGKPLTLRRIGGLDAIDEAIGRAAEMGRSILFVPGSMDVDRIQTLAALSILERVGKDSAQYEVPLDVMCRFPLIMTTAQETIKQSYLSAGRPDLYDPSRIRYVTDNQFAYAAAIAGHAVRERTAANFFIGEFFAESLVIAEAGNSTGAIQIAGTAQSHQLPFFLASCDYTLIGEELFAASAYLSREPILLGSILGQDWSKAAFVFMILLGILAAMFGWDGYIQWFNVE